MIAMGDENRESGLLSPDEQKLALRIAHMTLESYLRENALPELEAFGLEAHGVFQEERAVFVTLHSGKHLRGCIGNIMPLAPLWESIRSNAVAAAVHDRRFSPVTFAELDKLDLEISVLTPPTTLDDPLTFEVGRDGVIMEAGPFRSVFLPQVAEEQGWDQQTTLEHLSQKAGLDLEGWKKPETKFRVFQAQILKEE
jgi:AmmeMemoRadiSam system protein A